MFRITALTEAAYCRNARCEVLGHHKDVKV
jgi:hypothetical protein